jgi:hypothetical protein
MFGKILKKISSSLKEDPGPDASESYIELRNVLREILIPLGFAAEEKDIGIGEFAKYQRETLLVELYFDKRDWLFEFFASRDVVDPIVPPRQLSMTFSPKYYTDEQKDTLRGKLEEWLKTLEQK